MSAKILKFPSPLPLEYQPKLVVDVRKDSVLWLVEFECGHVAAFLLEVEEGSQHYCPICLENLVARCKGGRR